MKTKARRRQLVGNYSNVARSRAAKNNWHVIEEGQVRSAWNSYEVAKEFYDRLVRCFPDVTFELLQLDSLTGSGLRMEPGEGELGGGSAI